MRMSESTKRVLLAIASRLWLTEHGKRLDVECRGFVREDRRAQSAQVGRVVIGWRFYRTKRRGSDGKDEFLHSPVAVPDLPGHRSLLRFPEHSDLVAQRGKVRIAANVYRMLGTCLHARVALPAEIR